MTKIIEIDGENVILGTDDGKIKKVKVSNVNFEPIVGDEVEIYEGDDSIIVTKKENNYIDQSNDYINHNQGIDIMRIFMYISMIVSMVSCFLPFISVSFLSYSYSTNYVYNNGEVADGIFIIIIQFITIILLSCKKRTAVCILELISIFVFGFTVYYMVSNFSPSVNVSIYSFLGTGFYILAISLLTSAILSSIYAIRK